MNWMCAAVAALLIICTVLGARKGLLRQALTLFGALICLWLVSLLLPYSQEFIRVHTAVEQRISDRVDGMIAGGESGLSEEEQAAAGELSEEQKAEYTERVDTSKETQNSIINTSNLPGFLKEKLIENNNKEIYSRLGVQHFADYVKGYLSGLVIKILAYVFSFILAFVIYRIVLFAAHIVDHLPLARGLNKALGGMLGLAMGLIIIGLFFALLVPLYATDLGKACFEAIEDNSVLTYLYQHNPIMAVVTAFTG